MFWPIHRGMNTGGENWLLCKVPTLFSLICFLYHNFWTNYDLDLFSTSKWPSNRQFCERYKGSVEKMTRNCRKMIKKTADSLLCRLHSFQFSALFLLLSDLNRLKSSTYHAASLHKLGLSLSTNICCKIVNYSYQSILMVPLNNYIYF